MAKEKQEKNTEISARLSAILDYAGTVPNNFAKVLGYSRAQTIYDIINCKSAPSYDFFRRFAESEFSAIFSLRWLLTGEGEMLTNLLSKCPPEQQVEILNSVSHGYTISHIIQDATKEAELTRHLMSSRIDDTVHLVELEQKLKDLAKQNGELSAKAADAEKYYNTVIEQAKTIGRLEAKVEELDEIRAQLAEARREIESLKMEIGKNAPTHSHASTAASVVP